MRFIIAALIMGACLGTAATETDDLSDLNTTQLDTLVHPDFTPGDVNASDKTGTPRYKEDERLYRTAKEAFKVGSYYEAVDALAVLVKDPDGAFFVPGLLLSGQTYLKIGSKTGVNKYLWNAEAYLNLYRGSVDTPVWEYYYIKGKVYENLDFPERAEVFFKQAIERAKTEQEIARALVGLMRIAVWKQRIDLPTKYLILENVAMLKSSATVEYDFIQGMAKFLKKEYAEALADFQNTYRRNEHYLIDNPEYYLLVAESAYRDGKYKIAEHFFRRIIAVTKSSDVIQKALMRMGDLAWRQQRMKTAANYYYLVAKKFPDTNLAAVAKLKLIELMERGGIEEQLLALDAKAFSDPQKYIVVTLAKNRTSFVGRYALADFGKMVFGLHSKLLDERMVWELSLLSPTRLDYEQKEYIARLWKPDLLEIDASRICAFYAANEALFRDVFDQQTLIRFSQALESCGSHDVRLQLLHFIARKWHTDANLIRLSQFLYGEGNYADALETLQGVKQRDCDYATLSAKNHVMLTQPLSVDLPLLERTCSPDNNVSQLLQLYPDADGERLDEAAAFAREHLAFLEQAFSQERVAYRFMRKLLLALIRDQYYARARQILLPMAAGQGDNCFLNSLVLLSSIRSGNVDMVEQEHERIAPCENDWARVAKRVFASYRLSEKAQE